MAQRDTKLAERLAEFRQSSAEGVGGNACQKELQQIIETHVEQACEFVRARLDEGKTQALTEIDKMIERVVEQKTALASEKMGSGYALAGSVAGSLITAPIVLTNRREFLKVLTLGAGAVAGGAGGQAYKQYQLNQYSVYLRARLLMVKDSSDGLVRGGFENLLATGPGIFVATATPVLEAWNNLNLASKYSAPEQKFKPKSAIERAGYNFMWMAFIKQYARVMRELDAGNVEVPPPTPTPVPTPTPLQQRQKEDPLSADTAMTSTR